MQSELDWRHDLAIDTTRIRKELGFEERTSPEAALDRTIEWERAHPPEWKPEEFDYAAEDRALSDGGEG